jgi:hypothetical protein
MQRRNRSTELVHCLLRWDLHQRLESPRVFLPTSVAFLACASADRNVQLALPLSHIDERDQLLAVPIMFAAC